MANLPILTRITGKRYVETVRFEALEMSDHVLVCDRKLKKCIKDTSATFDEIYTSFIDAAEFNEFCKTILS